ncbi:MULTISPECIES: translation elongation factor Ts [Methylorubrum]|jgi:elongation factor Ts|uniref:Elongation factor Ts n=3 Tax=Methylorubrum TaxID=2282523 RepID=EFTS_METPB|nr:MULTISPECIES: translation elongation factor Ts [Methylorubrum]B1ZLB6.1 RecName: Full=Elongation factor Ts; Short=EF-Ts [Methylorubrum populi BJ001]ACB80197.1 translation elongation factor Ts [Methylorubrum populi BJ001]KAB7785566.1 Translation elongation factor Ts [Methylorubrum populi]MBA8911386.1 elongation factor Ts [Methylorubrum thiocyanatum]OAH17188.1 elongation factor Ts [Methylorubrum populi]PZP68547.1 MAG: elongation factor Ts [Methylorubrum populi]
MANITAALVKELREKTGAGMMDCKGALNETNGDLEAAVDWLRKKGLAKAAKKAGRVAAEGLVAVESAGHHAAIVEVNSETDFVARNDGFQAFAREAAKLALNTDGTLEGLQAATFPGSSETVQEKLSNLIATIGENMTLRRVAKLEVSKGVIASYVHGQISEGLGKIGVLVALESEGDVEVLSTLGRQIAMHIAATSPVALDASGVDPAVVERESNILREKNAGKPDHVMAKIVESGLKSYYKEVTLLEQPFVHDGSKTITQVLKEAAGKAGAEVAIKGFIRYALGEGIEKEEGPDFAAEVASMSR